ncbi:MAG: TetR/AcrR family transcriptional regulator [Ignavibacteriales bacterium]
MSHLDRRQREREEIRLKLLDAARDIAIKEGWHAVTIRKIADKVEYTPPIVYEYFENKEDLFRELVYSGFEILRKQFEEASLQETNPKKLMVKIALIHFNFALKHKELFQLMFNIERQKPNESMQYNMTLMERTIRQISKEDNSVIREQIFAFLCLCHGAISFMLQTEKETPHSRFKDFPKLYERMVERFINSL